MKLINKSECYDKNFTLLAGHIEIQPGLQERHSTGHPSHTRPHSFDFKLKLSLRFIMAFCCCVAYTGASAQNWGYTEKNGPKNWQNLSNSFERCAFGRDQSPIDLVNPKRGEGDLLKFSYAVSTLRFKHMGHWLRLESDPGSYLENGRSRFELQNIEFRTPSEHTISGKRFPLELQFLHKNTKSSSTSPMAMVSLFVEVGAENAWLAALLTSLPQKPQEITQIEGLYFNSQDWLPKDLSYFYYPGSLTYPPCEEGVSWHILQKPQSASKAQLAKLSTLFGNNSRPVQERKNRILRAQQASPK